MAQLSDDCFAFGGALLGVDAALALIEARIVPVVEEESVPLADAAGRILGAAVPAGFPDKDLQDLLDLYEGWLRDDPAVLGFGPWIVIGRDERAVVGGASFVGKPNDAGEVEIGFGIAPEQRGHGYATEAAAALVAWGLAQPGVESIVARCEPTNAASIRVLEKAGLARRAIEGPLLGWVAEPS